MVPSRKLALDIDWRMLFWQVSIAEAMPIQKKYTLITGDLSIGENAGKFYVKRISAQFNAQSRSELIAGMLAKEDAKSVG